MAVDPAIALQFHNPQQADSPIQTIGALMALRGQLAEIPLRLAQAEHARQQAAQEAIVTEQKNRQLQDESTLKELMADPTIGPKIASGDLSPLNGRVNYDFQQGIAKNVEEIHKNAALASKDDLANKSTALNALAEGIQGLGEDPAQINANLTAFKSNPANQLLFKNAGIDPNTIPAVTDAADLRKWEAGVGVAQAVTNKALAIKKEQAGIANTEAEKNLRVVQAGEAATRLENEAANLPRIQAEAEQETRKLEMMKGSTPSQWHAQVDSAIDPKSHGPLNARTKSLVDSALALGDFKAAQAAIKDGADQIGREEVAIANAKNTAGTKIYVAGAEAEARAKAATPTSEGLDMMAEAALSGQAPSSRNPIIVKQIWDRAAQIAASRGQTAVQALAAANAAKASRGALDSVTKQYETLKPFAEMAEKNADVLEKQIAKVSDLGAPFLNTPVRALESKFAGNTNVAAFHAAILPVQADFARILNSPTGGGVLSDTARSEMQSALGAGATVGQIKAALDIFRQDARNRKAAYEAQLADLKGASVAGGAATPAKQQYKAGDTRTINGVTYKRDDQGSWHAQ